ncbi:MAG: alpha-L-fucosidase [Sphingomicrobium sp.]
MSGIDRRGFCGASALLAAGSALARGGSAIAPGPVQPNWSSLKRHYRTPDWFRDAKFGIWSHWGPQSVPEQGDWYGRFLYMQGHPMADFHRRHFGHPSEVGMMEVQRRWTASAWQPDALMARYKAAGARYFVSLACHHDNLDTYDSRHHRWNSLRVGPRRDVVGTWQRAAQRSGLRFGVSNHASHAWHWYQPAYGYDPEGKRRGERYDAYQLTRADGRGKWWSGLDPQQLYTGRYMVPPDGFDSVKAMNDWHEAHDGQWIETAPPNGAFALSWLMRQIDLVERHRPDFCYFDNYGLPFGSLGMQAAADYLNRAARWRGDGVVYTAKKPSAEMVGAFTEDVERGFSDRLRDIPWQTDTCIGDWFYNRARFSGRTYVPAEGVLQRLADVVSKNGNLLLSIPQRGDGTIDSEEEKILDALASWMPINGEAIFGTRPWHRFGEGPTRLSDGMQGEGGFKGFVPGDIRFTTKAGSLYALILAPTDQGGSVAITSLGTAAHRGQIDAVRLLGHGPIAFRQTAENLQIEWPPGKRIVPVLKIDGGGIQ